MFSIIRRSNTQKFQYQGGAVDVDSCVGGVDEELNRCNINDRLRFCKSCEIILIIAFCSYNEQICSINESFGDDILFTDSTFQK